MSTYEFQDPEQQTGLGRTPSAKPETLCQRADEYVRENPVPAVLGAVALGFALGLLARGLEPHRRHEPIRDCFYDTSDMLGSFFRPLAKKTRHAYSASSSAVRDAVDHAAARARDVEVDDYVDPVVSWWKRIWS